jgi:hypothetical protein
MEHLYDDDLFDTDCPQQQLKTPQIPHATQLAAAGISWQQPIVTFKLMQMDNVNMPNASTSNMLQ